MQNERKVLISALLKAENNGYSNIVLNSVLNGTDLNLVSKAFVTTVFYGVLERKKTIDFLLNKFLKKPVEKAPPYTAAVLRSGVYQLLFMEKVPASAAVNESVKLIKRSKESGNSGLVNAVLRKFTDRSVVDDLAASATPEIKYSAEKWIYETLCNDLGEEKTIAFFENSLNPPTVFIRINLLKPDSENNVLNEFKSLGIYPVKTDLNGMYAVNSVKNIQKLKTFKNGDFFVQDYSSCFCSMVLSAKPGMRLLDCCAAPGGKSFSAAMDMQNKGEIISCDLHSHRVDLIRQGAERLGIDIIRPLKQNSEIFNAELGGFDRVLCDVPCSGIGVIRRKPEIKYKSDADCKMLSEVQIRILNTSSKYVKKGGMLIYSTCTLLKRENENIVTNFLKDNKSFCLKQIFGESGYKTFVPPESNGDGFFIAALERV